jgi:primase-polymerase (primpol)-like protein
VKSERRGIWMRVEPDYDALPERLVDRDQWVCWREQERDGKPTKLPVEPETGELASTTDDRTWRSFEEARGYAESEPSVDGLGFVFTATDPFVGVDLDDCRAPESGSLDERAQAIVAELDSYAEVSPSGTGVHVILEGELPGDRTRSGAVEMYDEGRYFTMTGAHLSLTPDEIVERPDALATVHAEHVASESETEGSDEPEDETSPVATTRGSGTDASGGEGSARSAGPGELADEVLLERAMAAANGDTFRQLWRGSTTGYPSQSEADMALCCLLAFWTGGDRQRMDRLFRESGLMREKWDEVHYADGRTYGAVTIERAIQVTDERYEPPTGGESRHEAGGSEAASGVTTETTAEAGDGPPVETGSGRSRAHLLERNRLLRQRVQEQAARIEALEAALERQSTEQSAGEPSEASAVVDESEDLASLHQRVRDWLTGES